jgi:hypothetical protein
MIITQAFARELGAPAPLFWVERAFHCKPKPE